jgi:hypothetical protein
VFLCKSRLEMRSAEDAAGGTSCRLHVYGGGAEKVHPCYINCWSAPEPNTTLVASAWCIARLFSLSRSSFAQPLVPGAAVCDLLDASN